MAILRKNQELWLGKEVESRIYYDVRYQGPGYNQMAFFAAVPQSQGSVKSIEGIEWIDASKGQKNGAYGFMDITEKGAIDKMKKYMTEDYNSDVKKVKVIALDNNNTSKSPYRAEDGGEKTERTVTFEYVLGIKVTRNGKTKYFELNSNGFETSHEIHMGNKTIVPWTEEREESCRLILAFFDSLQTRINSIITKDAIGMLEKNISFLLPEPG